MNYRTVTIQPLKTFDTDGTLILPIRGTDVISRITIKFDITKVLHAMSRHSASDITRIELVDGSDVLFSLTGYECQALCIYSRKCGGMVRGQHMGGNPERSFYGLDFGRYLYDPVLALDPKRFDNLQLKVTYTLNTMDADAAAGSIEVFSHVFDEKVVSPIGFLMSKEHYSYQCGADGSYEYIDLPTDWPLRKLLVRGWEDGEEPESVIESVRLDEDNLKRIPIDIVTKTYNDMMKAVWTPVQEMFSIIVSNAIGNIFYVTPTNYFPSIAGMNSGENLMYAQHGWMKGGKVDVLCITGSNYHGVAHGFLPNHCVEFPFGDPMDIDDWYDITKLDSLKLRLEAGDSEDSGYAQVVLEQLRKY